MSLTYNQKIIHKLPTNKPTYFMYCIMVNSMNVINDVLNVQENVRQTMKDEGKTIKSLKMS